MIHVLLDGLAPANFYSRSLSKPFKDRIAPGGTHQSHEAHTWLSLWPTPQTQRSTCKHSSEGCCKTCRSWLPLLSCHTGSMKPSHLGRSHQWRCCLMHRLCMSCHCQHSRDCTLHGTKHIHVLSNCLLNGATNLHAATPSSHKSSHATLPICGSGCKSWPPACHIY